MQEMKNMRYKIRFACAAAAILLFVSCTAEETAAEHEGAVVYPELRLSVSHMTMNAATRAQSPMSPDIEKYVKTIAVFEFDNEGLHDKGSSTYHFIDFISGTVDGVKGVGVDSTQFGIVETTLKGLSFEPRTDGTICVVANISEAQVRDFYMNHREPGQSYGRITLAKFKEWALPFEYEQEDEGTYDETVSGHVKVMYMFGYYQGEINPATSAAIRIDLGRLASRLDITVVNETGAAIEKRLGYHFDNVCSSAYFFPIKMGMPPTVGAGITRTIICSGKNDPVDNAKTEVPQTFEAGESHTRYFYVAAHSAKDDQEATKLHLFYDRRIVNDTSDETNSVKIPLCNVHPSQASEVANGYSLSRNTRYHFTIHLKKSASGKTNTRSEISEDRPGEITVYLP